MGSVAVDLNLRSDELATNIASVSSTVRELRLVDPRPPLENDGVEKLVEKLKNYPNVTTVTLWDNHIHAEGLTYLADLIALDHPFDTLHLGWNQVCAVLDIV